ARAREATGMSRQVYVAAPGEDWLDTIGEYVDVYVRKSVRANSGIDDLPKEDFEKRREGYLRKWLVAGTAPEVVEKLRPLAELGAGHVMCWVSFGHLPDHLVRRSLLRLATDVIPAVRRIRPDPAAIDQTIANTPAAAPYWMPSIREE